MTIVKTAMKNCHSGYALEYIAATDLQNLETKRIKLLTHFDAY